jgi:hypothetical protein
MNIEEMLSKEGIPETAPPTEEDFNPINVPGEDISL